ncbi:MAG: hypothetical protein AAF065_04305 [Verrucomicrobiota bacterium]
MKNSPILPTTLADVAEQSESLGDFGLLLREWNHSVTRGDISNRPALARSIAETPTRLAQRFPEGEIADAYLAAYAEWIADKADIERPKWTQDNDQSLDTPWFADNARASLLILTPASFRQRNVFTIPEDVIRLRRGRPKVSTAQKKAKARERDRRYRERIRKLVAIGRQQTA